MAGIAAEPLMPEQTVIHGDFNGDGYQDVATGMPDYQTIGAVRVLFGGRFGLSEEGTLLLTQRTIDRPQTNSQFGASLAVGDFNGDGTDDLAVGIPNLKSDKEWVRDGGVQIFFGGFLGSLGTYETLTGYQIFLDEPKVNGHEAGIIDFESIGVFPTPARDGDRRLDAGAALTAGDFNADGIDDLVVGAPYALLLASDQTLFNGDVDLDLDAAGAIRPIYGSPEGLAASLARNNTSVITQDFYWPDAGEAIGVKGRAEEGDFFGSVLATGDFDGNGYDDLAVGVPHDDIERNDQSYVDAGGVSVIYNPGSTWATSEFWHQYTDRDPDHSVQFTQANASERFGAVLATGNFNGDVNGEDDLAILSPGENERFEEGDLTVLPGSGNGFQQGAQYRWFVFAEHATSLAAAYFTSDQFEGLAIGRPFHGYLESGDVEVIDFLVQGYDEGPAEIGGTKTWNNGDLIGDFTSHFGAAVTATDINNDGLVDLVIADPYADSLFEGGQLDVAYGYYAYRAQSWDERTDTLLTRFEPPINATLYTGDSSSSTTLLSSEAGVSFSSEQRSIAVYGTDRNDDIVAKIDGDRLKVELIVDGDRETVEVLLTDVDELFVYGLAGDDSFDNLTAITSQAEGGTGNDTLLGGNGRDILRGGDGNDTIRGRGTGDEIYGDAGDDTLYGDNGHDLIFGGLGDDAIYGGRHSDELHGGYGQDFIDGGSHHDQIFGESGHDTLLGSQGADSLYGGLGDDYLDGGLDDYEDLLHGGPGSDHFTQHYAYFSFYDLWGRRRYGWVAEDTLSDFNTAEDTVSNLYGV